MPPEMPILDGAECSCCHGVAESAVQANSTWNYGSRSGDILCPDCSRECEDCGDVFAEEEVNEHGVCEDCEGEYADCEDCGNRTHGDRLTTAGRCEACQDNYRACYSCGGEYHVDEMTTSDLEWFCLPCYDEMRGNEGGDCDLIYEHSYKPTPVFQHIRGDSRFPGRWPFNRHSVSRMYLGVEIECESMRGTPRAEGAEIVPGFWYCKEDGSLHNGFEMVSHPATWGYWRGVDLDFLDRLKEKGFRSYNTETCGMHVHVSRNVLSRLDVYKLLRFCKNAPLFLLRVSRRKKANLERWASIFEGENHSLILKAKGEHDYNRYEAVNVTNSSTIEFRLFRGTLDKYAVRRNLAFVQALILFVRETSLKRLSSGVFQHWLKTRGGDLIGRNHAESLLESFTFIKEEVSVCA